MKQHDVVFSLSSSEKIVFFSLISIKELHCCSDCLIVFLNNTDYCILSNSSYQDNLHRLSLLLSRALNYELEIVSAIKHDLGFLMNENYQYDGLGFLYPEINDYFLWGSAGDIAFKTASWLYNGDKGSIVLEISPRYPWELDFDGKEPDFVPYDEWIKGYKPYLTTTIPREVAQKWLEQANELLAIVEQNVKKEFNIKD